MTVAKEAAADEKRRAAEKEFKNKKIRDLEIIDAEPIDLSDISDDKTENSND